MVCNINPTYRKNYINKSEFKKLIRNVLMTKYISRNILFFVRTSFFIQGNSYCTSTRLFVIAFIVAHIFNFLLFNFILFFIVVVRLISRIA